MTDVVDKTIPKKIHYFWFGHKQKSDLEKRCIESWKRFAPRVEIFEWNEENFDTSIHPYMVQAYSDKKWAFVVDYARLKVLYEEGGIYFDTDMLLVRDISPLFKGKTFLGYEDDTYLNTAALGARKGDPFIRALLDRYDILNERVPIPKVTTEVYRSKIFDITTYNKQYFYPFSQETIAAFDGTNAPKEAYGVHLWNYSWGNPLVRKLHKIKLYKWFVVLIDRLGLKIIIKRMMKME